MQSMVRAIPKDIPHQFLLCLIQHDHMSCTQQRLHSRYLPIHHTSDMIQAYRSDKILRVCMICMRASYIQAVRHGRAFSRFLQVKTSGVLQLKGYECMLLKPSIWTVTTVPLLYIHHLPRLSTMRVMLRIIAHLLA